MSGEIVIMIFNCYFWLCACHVSNSRQLLMYLTSVVRETSVCKWLQISQEKWGRGVLAG